MIDMKSEGHFKKAKAFERGAENWSSDEDAPSVISNLYNAAVHYVAYFINQRYGKDIDAHANQKRFLKKNNEVKILEAYNRLEAIRIRTVYGGGWNGDTIDDALEYLKVIKECLKEIGK
jgi:hypothetical protein